MTISSTVRLAGPYVGTGSVSTYPFGFKVFQASDLLVVQTDTSGNITDLVLTTNYSVTLNPNQDTNPGGSITLNVPLVNGYALVISSQVPQLQGTSITNNGGFYPTVIEDAMDYLTILIQQAQTSLNNCIQLPISITGVSATLPAPVGSQLIGWNAAGTALVNTSPTGLSAQVVTGGAAGAGGNIALNTITDTNVNTAAGIQSGKLAYLQGDMGSVSRTVLSKLGDVMSVLDFAGVDPTGSSDSTTGIQNAINACQGTLLFPKGTYICGGLSITKSLLIQGEGPGGNSTGSIIMPNSATANIFVCNTPYAVVFRDLIFQYGGTPTAGAAITWEDVGAVGTANLFSGCFNCRFNNVFIGVYAETCSSWTITDCVFWTVPAGGAGIQVDNTFNDDQGDQSIKGCTFLGNVAGIGILWKGGGGTRIVSNKFFMTQCINANLATTQQTAQLIIANNSFDIAAGATTGTPVFLNLASGTLAFQNIMITGNIFVGYFAMAQFLSIVGIATALISQVHVVGNNFINAAGSFTGNGMIAFDYVNQFQISDNLIIGPGSSNGVNIGAHCSNGSVVNNEIQSFTTNIANGATNAVRVRGMTNSGTTAGVADGGTITHGLGITPTRIIITGVTAAQTYTAFSPNSTTFSVSVRNTAGASGTASSIYWEVEA